VWWQEEDLQLFLPESWPKVLRMKAQEGILHTSSLKTPDFATKRTLAKSRKAGKKKTKENGSHVFLVSQPKTFAT